MSWKDPSPTIAIERAVKLFGGPTKTANALSVSGQAVHLWLQDGFVRDRDRAIEISEKCLARGLRLAPASLMGLPSIKEIRPDGGPNGGVRIIPPVPSGKSSRSAESPVGLAPATPAAEYARAA